MAVVICFLFSIFDVLETTYVWLNVGLYSL